MKIAHHINGAQDMTKNNTKIMLFLVGITIKLNFGDLKWIIINHVIDFYIVAAAIKEHVKDGEVVFNLVPKENAMSDIYCQLIPNDDPKQPFYEVVPRIGAFELSFNGVVRNTLNGIH